MVTVVVVTKLMVMMTLLHRHWGVGRGGLKFLGLLCEAWICKDCQVPHLSEAL